MRVAELTMAVVLTVFSLLLMWKSTELPIGWNPDTGPGGGAFPFWLSAAMGVCSIWIIVRWFRRASPPSRSEAPFMDRRALINFIIGAGSLTVMIGLIHIVGIYISVPLFLAFYIRFVGHHSWGLTAGVALSTPVFTFFFFDIALKIELPKGAVADWFLNDWVYYPLYDIFL